MFLRLDMPGHIKHKEGDTFSQVFLSYFDKPIPSKEFLTNFAPDEKFNYRRDAWQAAGKKLPERIIRGYKLRDPATGKEGPWLLGMTPRPVDRQRRLVPSAGLRLHDRGVRRAPHQSRRALLRAFIVGYFDSLDEAAKVYDQYKGASGLEVVESGWKLTSK
jgi:hypothetical protein